MTGLTPYSIDGDDMRKKAFVAVVAAAMVLAIILNLIFLPFLKDAAEELFDQGIIDAMSAVGLVSFGGIGTFTLFGIFWTLFDRWLWRKPPFLAIHGIPDLNGEWEGELISSFKDNSDVNTSCSMKLIITQTFSKMQCTSHYPSSSSRSAIIGIRECNPKTRSCLLEYSYGNEAGDKSVVETTWESEHLGFSRIRCVADKMDGQYFTNRTPGTKGAFSLHRNP